MGSLGRMTVQQDYTLVGDDVVIPFAVEPLDVRGRAVQLGPMLDQILKRHEYPEDICFLMGELVVLTVLLGTSLKFDGNFILQTQSDGPVSLAVVDFSTPDAVRAYARFDADRLEEMTKAGRATPMELLGNGIMGLTIDQGVHMQRYQGIVELTGQSLEEVAHQYFRQSEQIPTRIKLSVAQIIKSDSETGNIMPHWRAGGVMAQFMPQASERIVIKDLPGGDGSEVDDIKEDDAWEEAAALVNTVGDDELTDPQIGSERLLYRLFNEHGVRVFDGVAVNDKCSCSREKVIAMVKNFADDQENPDDGSDGFTTKCEFCGTVYNIAPEELV